MTQYALPIPALERRDHASYAVGEANRLAYEWLMRWPDWPMHGVMLVGPPGSGKRHLAAIWQAKSGGETLQVNNAISDENGCFHKINSLIESKAPLVLLSTMAPVSLPVQLPDLRSRLLLFPVVELAAPDDAMLRAIIRKVLADHQMNVEDEVLTYAIPRIERSYAAATTLAQALNQRALERRSAITIPLVREVLQG